MGHSAGGAFTQILLDHGYGAAGVAINSAPTEGVKVVPASQIKATFPVLKNPANHHKAVGLHARAVELRLHQRVPRGARSRDLRALPRAGVGPDPLGQRARQRRAGPPGHVGRLQERRPCAAAVHLGRRATTSCRRRIQQSNLKHYKSDTITEIKEFEGPHLLPAADDWEEVADYALEWASSTPSTRAA